MIDRIASSESSTGVFMSRSGRHVNVIRHTLSRLGILRSARRVVNGVIGNRTLRRFLTSNYASGKIAFGEKNHYVCPLFPVDWVRVDVSDADIDLDLGTLPVLPFDDDSQDILYASHLVEHLEDVAFDHFLRECCRILSPNGAIRIETPDAELLVDAYRARDETLLRHFRTRRRDVLVERLGLPEIYLEDHLTVLGELSSYIDPSTDGGHIPVYAPVALFDQQLETLDLASFARWCVALQTRKQLASGGHKNWMSWAKLESSLRAAGFDRVVRAEYGSTVISGLQLNHGPGCIREKQYRAIYSIYVEAFKSTRA